jgi:hypothetical protein
MEPCSLPITLSLAKMLSGANPFEISDIQAYRWKYRLQVASLVLSAIIGVIALHVSGGVKDLYPTLGGTVLIALLSGFLAPVARDLVAGIEKWRN